MTHDSTNLPLTAGEGEVIIACVRTAQCHHWRGEQDDGTEGAKQQNRTALRGPGGKGAAPEDDLGIGGAAPRTISQG